MKLIGSEHYMIKSPKLTKSARIQSIMGSCTNKKFLEITTKSKPQNFIKNDLVLKKFFVIQKKPKGNSAPN